MPQNRPPANYRPGTWTAGENPPVGPLDTADETDTPSAAEVAAFDWNDLRTHPKGGGWTAPTHVLGQMPPETPPAIDGGHAAELRDWWLRQADSDLEMLLPKAASYSAHDIRITGHVLADLIGIAPVDDAFASELACAVYLMSKVTRLLGAYKEGRLPTADSITDSRVYATMIARIRDNGAWPGWADHNQKEALGHERATPTV